MRNRLILLMTVLISGCSPIQEVADYSANHKVSCQMKEFKNCAGSIWDNGKYISSKCDNIYVCSDGHVINIRY